MYIILIFPIIQFCGRLVDTIELSCHAEITFVLDGNRRGIDVIVSS